MQRSHSLAAAVCALLLCTAASAQLKAPRKGASAAAPAAAAPAASAPAADTKSAEQAEKEKAAALAAQGWLTLLDRKDWGTAWEASSSVFRGAVPLSNWMDAVPKVRADLGALADRAVEETVYKTQLEGRPAGEYVTVLFTSRFEQRELEEVVTTQLDRDGRWRVTGYSTR